MPDSPPSERRPVRPRPAVKTATRIAPSRPAAAPTRTRVVAPAGLASALSPTAVRAAQSFLNDRSGLNLAVDGVVGPETLAAAQVFVRRHGLADVKTSVGRTLVRIIDLEADDVAPPASLPVWIFYAGSPKAEADWTTALAPGSTIFWIHGRVPRGGAYKRRIHEGDTVLLLVGQKLIASGVLLADDRQLFVDAEGRVRRPVRVLERYVQPFDREELEAAAGGSLIKQGSVHPVSHAVLAAINGAKIGSARNLPYPAGTLGAMLKDRPLIADVETAAPYILPDAKTARDIGWSGRVWTPDDARREDEASRHHTLEVSEVAEAADDLETTEVDALEPARAGGEGRPGADAQIPFVLDAPAENEDELDRGPFALFLAQRLHLIWCQMNGHAPDGRGGRTRAALGEADTFIAHVDSPWGGGKTTFANFVARVLDPRCETLSARHFLRSSLAPTTPEADLAAVPLGDVFAPPYTRDDPDRWRQARQPWVVTSYNAWRDQYVQPPWWQVFLTLQSAVAAEVRRDAWRDLKASLDDPPRIEPAVAGFVRWAGIAWNRYAYQIWNRKLKGQLWLCALTAILGLVLWRTGVVAAVMDASTPKEKLEAKQISDWLALAVALVGVGGASISALFTAFTQSLAPELDFTAEHRQIGVQDPIRRFRRTFEKIVRATDRPVLLIVDDLDRCDPKTVVELLRGFQTIIRSPRLFVLLLGDRAWIENAHDVHHKELASLREDEGGLGARFVQKVIQLSSRLPIMKPEARTRFAQRVLGEAPPDATSTRVAEVLRQADDELTTIVAEAIPVGAKEARVAEVVRRAQEALPDDLSPLEAADAKGLVQQLGVVKFVSAAGADTAQQRSVFNAVTRLIDSLPNNPRQIKRIFMAFATYEVVGRTYFGYQLTPEGDDGPLKARRWRQLAMWVTLAVEWPASWRALARNPLLLEAAYAPAKSRKRAEARALAQTPETQQPDARALLARLRTDPALVALLSAAPATEYGDDFTHTALEVDAIHEFNRIIWEPGFQLEPRVGA
ncbi:MAG: P-loop NTPase fold protein [Pseudomonadota bacterium]